MKKITLILSLLMISFLSYSEGKVDQPKRTGISLKQAKIISVSATTTLAHKKNRYNVKNLFDKNISSCWVEGEKDFGKTSVITITFNQDVMIDEFFMLNGYNRLKTYEFNNRIKDIEVNGQLIRLEDKGMNAFQSIKLKRPVVDKKLKLKIISVYKGSKWNDTCISEIVFSSSKIKEYIENNYRYIVGEWGNEGEETYCTIRKDGTFDWVMYDGDDVTKKNGNWAINGNYLVLQDKHNGKPVKYFLNKRYKNLLFFDKRTALSNNPDERYLLSLKKGFVVN